MPRWVAATYTRPIVHIAYLDIEGSDEVCEIFGILFRFVGSTYRRVQVWWDVEIVLVFQRSEGEVLRGVTGTAVHTDAVFNLEDCYAWVSGQQTRREARCGISLVGDVGLWFSGQ